MKLALKEIGSVILLSIIALNGVCQESAAVDLERPTLREVALWIREHVRFPQDIGPYGTVGTEQFVVSAAWDGRVFISSPLHTLNPAFECVIKEAVAQAPKCRFAGETASDLYERIEIDFAALHPGKDKSSIIDVAQHTFPIFPGQKAREESREKFVEWLSVRCERSKKANLHDYVDTVRLHYTVTATGEVEHCSVSEYRDVQLQNLLERGLRQSPCWTPAKAANRMPIAVSVCERIIVRTDAAGRICPLELLRDEECCNSSEAPDDCNRLVWNPEVKPQLLGEYNNLGRLLAARVEFKVPTEYACSFVIERDGSVGELRIETTDEETGRAIAAELCRTSWSPALQSGQAVRTSWLLHERRGPKRETEVVYAPLTPWPHFMTEGRHAPFSYDDKAQQRRWKRFLKAYPEAAATIHGYGRFRKLDNMVYLEALTRRNALQPTAKTIEKTNHK